MSGEDSADRQNKLIQRALQGSESALAELYAGCHDRLYKMVNLRMHRLVRARVSPSDVLQDAFIDLAKQLEGYSDQPKLPFFVWVRRLTGQRLAKVHREHLGAQARNAGREVSIHGGRVPQATSQGLASKLMGTSGVLGKMQKAEQQCKLQEILDTMKEEDREILAMRHFEEMNNREVAAVLDISEQTSSMRHLRALRRLSKEMQKFPEWFGTLPKPAEATPPGREEQGG